MRTDLYGVPERLVAERSPPSRLPKRTDDHSNAATSINFLPLHAVVQNAEYAIATLSVRLSHRCLL